MIFYWFASKTVRTARDMYKHVRKMLNAQRDILSPPAVSAVEAALADVQQAVTERAGDEALKKQMTALETAANKWLRPYPNAVIRENVEVLLVALAVAMDIRTFILQPFKIPTGSMQPTLFGVTPSSNVYPGHNQPDLKVPGAVPRFFDYWINGNSYFAIDAPADGQFQGAKAPTRFLLFNLKQEYEFNNQWFTIWFPPDDLFQRAGVTAFTPYKAGQPIVRLKVTAGDHLFVDRLSYNFRRPSRGDIVVFETRGIPENMRHQPGFDIPADQFYIKRLVALGGERVQIGDDRHLIINGHRLDTNTPHFENVYSFDPNQPPRDSHYSGHLNGHFGQAPLFPDPATTYNVRPGYYMVMGDNTVSSLDSRFWGDFPESSVIGKYFFVYWPFSDRFGMNVR
jgi:signal peptidase I